METCSGLPAPEVCQIEKFVSSADYWTCLVEESAPCQYVVTIGTVQICSMASKSGASLKMKIEGKKIVVRYADSSLGVVSLAMLDKLIKFGRISAFERSSGWVDIVNDPIRKETSLWRFKGLQRRKELKGQPLTRDILEHFHNSKGGQSAAFVAPLADCRQSGMITSDR